MKYKRFEGLPVWESAINLAKKAFLIFEVDHQKPYGDLRSQIERAALSVSNNIAEGFERGTTQELLTFLYVARGSAGEVRSMLCLMDRLAAFTHLKTEISDLTSLSESISRQLRASADSLQNSNIKGQRYLSSQSKQKFDRQREINSFMEELKRVQHQKV
ncbi:MAG: four helix bundle protein [Acidobacteriia bacterium]|nr:four helix bundle protein [Terriglobia bacterium]